MTQTTTNSNGRSNGRTEDPSDGPAPDRRQTAASPSVRPDVLVERHVENARRQLADARERLKAARRRVVQLEDALGNWERFAAELRQSYEQGTPPA